MANFGTDLWTLIVLCGPASELSIPVNPNLVRAFLYLCLAPGLQMAPSRGEMCYFPPSPFPLSVAISPLVIVIVYFGLGRGGVTSLFKNRSPHSLFLSPDFPDFFHFLYCVHRHTPHCPSSSEPKGSPRHPNGLPSGESARGFPLPRQMGVFSNRSRFSPLYRVLFSKVVVDGGITPFLASI